MVGCCLMVGCACRMLPGLNSAAVELISGAVGVLTFQIHSSSPFPTYSMCIGEKPSAMLHSAVLSPLILTETSLHVKANADILTAVCRYDACAGFGGGNLPSGGLLGRLQAEGLISA